MMMYEDKNSVTVEPASGKNPRELYEHQIDAIKALNHINEHAAFNTLLVLPTGSGKTLTAVYWLLKNATNKGAKILWIAHRYLLLDQAAEAFAKNGYSDMVPGRAFYKYRIISGIHDRPIDISGDEDILICGKDSIVKQMDKLDEWMTGSELYLVIDEAHHSVAHTYQLIIDHVKQTAKKNNINVKMLGLTATPYRTDENEKAALGLIFPDDIVYKVDLLTLIKKQILSTPIFCSINTHMSVGGSLNKSMIRGIVFSDQLPEDIAKQIAGNSPRNRLIVQKYLEKKDEYGQTIVFAINIRHAIELNAVFKKHGVKSDFIVSGLIDSISGISKSKEENERIINEYREKKIQVLINVNILTEGTDLPQTKTVFLTRPTVSRILMTQMIGRALRGEKAGGTKEAHILSFLDDWEDKITWETPESILMDGVIPSHEATVYRKQRMQHIAISLIEEFARILDETVDTSDLENLPFSERIPIGYFLISYLEDDPENETNIERNNSVLVYNSSQKAYKVFLRNMDSIMEKYGIDTDKIGDQMIDRMVSECRKKYFHGIVLPPVKDAEIEALLRYYAYSRKTPELTTIDALDRAKVNLSNIAQDILDKELNDFSKRDYLNKLWNDETTLLKIYYSEFEYFKRQLDKEINKIVYPEVLNGKAPTISYDKQTLEHFTLQEIIERAPQIGLKLKDKVFASACKDGVYYCASCGLQSPHKKDFQIDHIKPISKGGLTVRGNLQLLCRKCNWIKSDHEDDLPLASRELSDDVIPQVIKYRSHITVTLGDETKEFTITPDRRNRGTMTFQIGGNRYIYNFKNQKTDRLW